MLRKFKLILNIARITIATTIIVIVIFIPSYYSNPFLKYSLLALILIFFLLMVIKVKSN